MQNSVIEMISKRRSTREFTLRQLDDEYLEMIMEAGSSAPYAGDQICTIVAIQNLSLIERINTEAKKAAIGLGIEHLKALGCDESFSGSYNAPTVIFVCGKENAVAPQLDCAAITQNMLIAAESLKLGACWVHFPIFAFYSTADVHLCEELKIPTGYKPYTCIALGYRNEEKHVETERDYATHIIIK